MSLPPGRASPILGRTCCEIVCHMSCHILGFPLMATAQARREAALGCRTPLVDFACTACGQRASFAAWANTLVLAPIACRRCGEVGRWGLSHLQPTQQPVEKTIGQLSWSGSMLRATAAV